MNHAHSCARYAASAPPASRARHRQSEVQPLFANWEIVRQLNARVPWPLSREGRPAPTIATTRCLPSGTVKSGTGCSASKTIPRKGSTSVPSTSCSTAEAVAGFWIAQPWQGRGLMSEAVAAISRFWFEDLGQPILRVKKARDQRRFPRRLPARRRTLHSARLKMTSSPAGFPQRFGSSRPRTGATETPARQRKRPVKNTARDHARSLRGRKSSSELAHGFPRW